MASSSKRGEYGRQRRKYVAEGFIDDAFKLLCKFTESNLHDLPNFVKLWNEEYMPMIYMGRTSKRELCEFTNECFATMIALITNEESQLIVRVAATYLLYCLYASQPFDRYKIRITIKDFKSMYSLVDRAVTAKIPDLVYAVMKLKHESAFHFVGNMTLMGPEIPNTRCIIRQEKVLPMMVDNEWSQHIRAFWDSQSLQKFNHIDKTFENMKRAMNNPGNSRQTEEVGPNASIVRLVQMAASGDPEVYSILETNEDVSTVEFRKEGDIGMRRIALKQQQMEIVPNRRRATHKKRTAADDSAVCVENDSDNDDLCIDDSSVTKSRKSLHKRKKKKNGQSPAQTQKAARSSRKSRTRTFDCDSDDDPALVDEEADDPDEVVRSPRRSLRPRAVSEAAANEVDTDQEEKIEISDSGSDYQPGIKKDDWTFDFSALSTKSPATRGWGSTSSKAGSKKGKTAIGDAQKTPSPKLGRRKRKKRVPTAKIVRRKIGRGKKLKRHYNTDSDDDADPLQNVNNEIESGDDPIADIAESMNCLFQMKSNLEISDEDSHGYMDAV